MKGLELAVCKYELSLSMLVLRPYSCIYLSLEGCRTNTLLGGGDHGCTFSFHLVCRHITAPYESSPTPSIIVSHNPSSLQDMVSRNNSCSQKDTLHEGTLAGLVLVVLVYIYENLLPYIESMKWLLSSWWLLLLSSMSLHWVVLVVVVASSCFVIVFLHVVFSEYFETIVQFRCHYPVLSFVFHGSCL